MNNKTASATREPATWDHDPTDRLFELLSSFSDLRSSNRVLVDQIRDSIDELRHLRNQLRNKQKVSSQPVNNGAAGQRDLQGRFGLTRREVEVALLLAQGRSNQVIARELKISPHTARHHTQRILSKLDVHSRSEAGAKLRG